MKILRLIDRREKYIVLITITGNLICTEDIEIDFSKLKCIFSDIII